MKNIAIVVLLVTTVVFGALALKQNQKKTEAQTTAAALQEKLTEAESRIEEQQKRSSSLQTRLRETRTEAVTKADEVSHLEQALTNQVQTASTRSNSSNPLAEMFKSPEMKDMIRSQQKAVLGPMIEKNYAAYFASLGLTPEQKTTLKDMITKRGLIDAEMGVSLISGDLNADKRKELAQQAKTDKDTINDQIKEFLGDDNYTQFQAYEKTQPERMVINSFKDQQGTGPGALSPDQESRLLQAMGEERQNFKFTTDYTDQSKFNGDFASYFTEEKLSKFEQEKAQLDQRYLTRAQDILSGDQVGAFDKFLTSQTELQKVGMKMAAKMFGSKERTELNRRR